MKKVRIISRLDIKGPNLVKGIHLEGLRVLGDPSAFARRYYLEGADEIFYMDCVASLYERNSLIGFVEKTAADIFIPMTVGGGLRSIQDIRAALSHGADKVSLNTAAIKNPNLIEEASRLFGTSTIVGTVEAVKQSNGKYLAFVDNGREQTMKEVYEWAKDLENLGAGELVITSVDREGTGKGLDFELTAEISSRVKIPVIAHGGASSINDICHLFLNSDASGVCIASALHYDLIKSGKIARSPTNNPEGNTSFLSSGKGFSKVNGFSISSLKVALKENGIPCRGSH